VPVHALGREEGVVLLEGLPEDVEGRAGVLGRRAHAGAGQRRDTPEVPAADGGVRAQERVVPVRSGGHGQDDAIGRGAGAGTGPPCGVAFEAADGGGLLLLESSVPVFRMDSTVP
jgi:hypothetical protein